MRLIAVVGEVTVEVSAPVTGESVALRTFFLEGMFEAGWGRGRRSELGWQEKWGGREKWTGGDLKLVGWEGRYVQAVIGGEGGEEAKRNEMGE